MELATKVEALKRGGVSLPNDLLDKVDSINEKWELLGVFAFLLLFVGYVYIFGFLKYAVCLISNLKHKYLFHSIHYIHFKQATHAITQKKYPAPPSIVFSLSPFLFPACLLSDFNNFSSLIWEKM